MTQSTAANLRETVQTSLNAVAGQHSMSTNLNELEQCSKEEWAKIPPERETDKVVQQIITSSLCC